MRNSLRLPRWWVFLIAGCFATPVASRAQLAAPQTRITQPIRENAVVTLRGNTHPLAQPQYDRGSAPADLPMARMLLVLKRSDAQQPALDKLLDDQQDPNSSAYHQWLNPIDFGRQFGPSDSEIQTVTAWLQSHGFQIGGVARGRTVIEFSGTASQIQQAFHTEIHKFVVNGEEHWANASDPQIPAALSPVISGIDSLHNFPRKPTLDIGPSFTRSRATGELRLLGPDFTVPDSQNCGLSGYCYLVGPYDFAKIYHVDQLWNATPTPIDGTGQKIAIVGVSNINVQDVRDFRNLFGLPANDPQIQLDGPDPGIVQDAETEALIDVEWSGAVAKGATIILVPDASTNGIDGVDLSALYIVENNLAPVVSASFGECELFLGTAGNAFANAIREQAAAQGITFINSAGDEGVSRCDPNPGSTPAPATHGYAVNGLASSPYVVAVGGTDFANYPNLLARTPSPYWNASNNNTTQASVLGYVPETTWNSNCTNAVFSTLNYGSTPEAVCNGTSANVQRFVRTTAGGGGKSNCISSDGATVSSCSGGYLKPSWQSALGVPTDYVRDIPDVSLFASGGFMDSAYILCEADQPSPHGSCGLTNMEYDFLAVGGTSVSAPAFAGMMALVNQYTQSSGQGNANYVLYKLANSSTQKNSSCNASSNPAGTCIFNDVTAGTIDVPCQAGSTSCTPSVPGDTYGVIGENAGTGYDLATGLGSVNAYNLVHNWIGPSTPTTTSLVLNSGNAVNITHGKSVPVSITVSPNGATGNVTLIGNPGGQKSLEMGSYTLSASVVNSSTVDLSGGNGNSYQVKAYYAGDSKYAPSVSGPVTVTVTPESSKTWLTIDAYDPTTINVLPTYNPSSITYGTLIDEVVDIGNALSQSPGTPARPLCNSQDCPTGTVALTDSVNGGPAMPIGSGTYPLDLVASTGAPPLPIGGGTHLISASYSGDLNFSPSSANNYTLTVAPAATQVPAPIVQYTTTLLGSSIWIQATVNTNVSAGKAPTPAIAFYDGGTQVPGSVYYSSGGGIVGAQKAYLVGNGQVTFSSLGPHSLTAKFAGDANYAPSTSPTTTVNIVNQTNVSANVQPATIYLGQSATVTVVVSTQSKIPAMTGTVQIVQNNSNSIPVAVTASTDANGYQQLIGAATISPQNSISFNVVYSGDSNYSVGSYFTSLSVTVPDFSVSTAAPGVTVTAGSGGTDSLTITPMTNQPSIVALSCNLSSLAGSTCSFNPSSPLSLSNAQAVSTTATISVMAPSISNSTSGGIPELRGLRQTPSGNTAPGGFAFGALIALGLISIARSRQRLPGRVALAGALMLVLGCGGNLGGGGAGGTGGVTQPTPTTISFSTASTKVAFGSPVIFNATVKSSQSASGTVLFMDSGSVFAVCLLQSGGVATGNTAGFSVGTHVITAQYLGDQNNLRSNSAGALNVAVTGTAAISIQGVTSNVFHNIPLTVTVQ